MENKKTNYFKDPVYITGLVFIAASLFFYLVPDYLNNLDRTNFFAYFWVHYIISAVFLVVLLINGLVKFNWNFLKAEIHLTFMFLILCMISCFALNKEINIFYDSTGWLNVLLITLALAMIATPFKDKFPIWLEIIFFFIIGLGLLICIYFSVYLFPYYGIGIVGVLFLGISLHVFIPLLMTIYLSIYTVKNFIAKKHVLISFSSALLLALSFTIYFIVKWNITTHVIAFEYNKTIINQENIYPAWYRVSQKLSTDWITERVLKSNLYYATPKDNGDFWGLPSRSSMDIVKVHDPLIMIASFFSTKPDITIDDRIKIIETTYGARHLTQQRLWSGESLFTKNIITDVNVYPKLRIAYTEKILSIENRKVRNGWREETQEAIYTFSIPQGAVVSSLSLWINGIEEKGHLTTKGKADTAYTSIVGVERRDPSVVHWQEGNTISVRVFPCSPAENRRFKIGITSPLELLNNKLVYKDIKFKGPFSEEATETINLRFDDTAEGIELPFDFEKTDDRTFIWEGNYQEDWKIEFPITKIPNNHFSFDGNTYSISEQTKEYETLDAKNIYLDINNAWTSTEFETIWEKTKNTNVFVFQDKMIKLNEENKNEWFDRLSKLNFSMFPFQLMDTEAALVISKSTKTNLFLKDIENSIMSKTIAEHLSNNKKVRLYNLGPEISPYLRTLRDFRALVYDAGDIKALTVLLEKKLFIKLSESENTVTINDTGIKINKIATTVDTDNNAPDHLVRLFSFNNILRKIEGNYFRNDYVNAALISEAEKAYVVTPISSLIVLETQNDYERFGIKDSENNSLKNASMAGAGSVPEPHEWALIILACLFLLYLKFKNKLVQNYAG